MTMVLKLRSVVLQLALSLALLPGALASAADSSPAQRPGSASLAGRNAHRRTVQSLEYRVRLLTRSLDLDPGQQARLRKLLEGQRDQLLRVRTDPVLADRQAAIKAILERTGDEIRAMLNDEQRKKYQAKLPRGDTRASQADVEYWMARTRQKQLPQEQAPQRADPPY
jgi:hypothetical protein